MAEGRLPALSAEAALFIQKNEMPQQSLRAARLSEIHSRGLRIGSAIALPRQTPYDSRIPEVVLRSILNTCLLFLLSFLLITRAPAAIRLPKTLSDHMVLQRDAPIHL